MSDPIARTRVRRDSEGDVERLHTIEFDSKAERDVVLDMLRNPDGWVERITAERIDRGATEHWIQTFSGEKFCPAAPEVDKIHLVDIAHAVSNLSRYCGHCSSFYSVGEHCTFVATEMVKKRLGSDYDIWSLWDLEGVPEVDLQMIRSAFMHDASEAYVCDLTAPVKSLCNGYRIIERRVEAAIQKRFNLRFQFDLPEIHECDVAVFLAEKAQLMKEGVEPWSVAGEPADTGPLHCWAPPMAKEMFLRAASCLGLH